MAHKKWLIAFSAMVASPLLASQPEAVPAEAAPPGGPATEYCLRVEAVTGSRLETVLCKTREEWAAMEIDVDQEWAKGEGVAVKG